MKSALSTNKARFPELTGNNKNNKPKINILNYSDRTRFLLNLNGGTSFLNSFIRNYEKKFDFFHAPLKNKPVIIILDNDSGCQIILNELSRRNAIGYSKTANDTENYRIKDFIHICRNLYLVLTPLNGKEASDIEDLFSIDTLSEEINGKKFNKSDNYDKSNEYGKIVFAKEVVNKNKNSIDFSKFYPLFDNIINCLKHYEEMK